MPTFDEMAKNLKLQQTQQPTQQPTGKISFLERLKLGFGGKEAKAEQQRLETEAGLKGKIDIGDLADIAGASLPIIGGILGGAGGTFAGFGVGAVPGAAIGAVAGESVKQAIGRGLGVREEVPLTQEAKELAITGVGTYAGGKALGLLAKAPGVKQTIGFVTKKLPERFYSTFFKTTSDDMAKQIRTGAMAKLQTENPKLFNEFVKNGIIKYGTKGKIEINPTLAKQALERSLGSGKTGRSLEKMAEYSYLKQFELEAQARNFVKGTKYTIDLGKNKKGYLTMLKDMMDDFKKEGYGFLKGATDNVEQLYTTIKNTKGTKISAETSLMLRRTMDNLRSSSSFRESAKLSNKQGIFKVASNELRVKLAQLPGFKNIMAEYKFYIDAADGLVKEAARRGNARIFSLFDAIVGGTSIGANQPGGLGLLATLRTIQTPAVLTSIARGLYSLPEKTTKTIPFVSALIGQKAKQMFK